MAHDHFRTTIVACCSLVTLISISSTQEIPKPIQPPTEQQSYYNLQLPQQKSVLSGQAQQESSALRLNRTRLGVLPEVSVEVNPKVDNKVGVHIPLVFDMTNSIGTGKNQSKLDLSVLSGLVTVNKDKERNPITGEVSGPMTVTVFGIPVYSGKTTRRRNAIQNRHEDIEKEIQARQASISDGLNSASDSIQNTVVGTNEKVLDTLSGLVERITGLIRRPLEN